MAKIGRWIFGAVFVVFGAVMAGVPAQGQSPGEASGEGRGSYRVAAFPDPMFIGVTVPRHRLYLGEVIRVEYDVFVDQKKGYVLYDVREPDFLSWYVKEDTPGSGRVVMIDGRAYTKEPFAVYYLAPLRIGQLKLPALSVEVPFADPVEWITHDALVIEVMLAPEPAPVSFFPQNVGRMSIEMQLPEDLTVSVGASFSVDVRITSDGPADGVVLSPMRDLPPGSAVTIYPPMRIHTRSEIREGNFFSETVFRIRIVPHMSGDWQIPSVQIVAFNPGAQKYETLETQAFMLRALPPISSQGGQRQTPSSLLEDALPVPIVLAARVPNGLPSVLWFLLAPGLCAMALLLIQWRTRYRRMVSARTPLNMLIEHEASFRGATEANQQLSSLKKILAARGGIVLSSNRQVLAERLLGAGLSEAEAQVLSEAITALMHSAYSDGLGLDEARVLQMLVMTQKMHNPTRG